MYATLFTSTLYTHMRITCPPREISSITTCRGRSKLLREGVAPFTVVNSDAKLPVLMISEGRCSFPRALHMHTTPSSANHRDLEFPSTLLPIAMTTRRWLRKHLISMNPSLAPELLLKRFVGRSKHPTVSNQWSTKPRQHNAIPTRRANTRSTSTTIYREDLASPPPYSQAVKAT
jgi:hypothetical protein